MGESVFGKYDFGLSEEEESRAGALHSEATIVDLMLQGPVGYRAFDDAMVLELREVVSKHGPLSGLAHGIGQPIRAALEGNLPMYEQSWRESGITAANLQVNVMSVGELLAALSVRQAEFDGFPWLLKAGGADDIREAKSSGSVAGFLNLQFVPVDVRDLSFFDAMHRFGIRMIGLTYNSMNGIGSGCTERTDAGVSNFGARVIEHFNSLGIIVDVAHAGRQTTLDACAISAAPVVASHTSAEALFPAARAKSDEELHAVAESGGVVGICALPIYLCDDPDASIEVLLDHIDYVVKLVGTDHVALGTDWPMQLPHWYLQEVFETFALEMGFRPGETSGAARNLVGFDDYRDYPNITRGLVRRGYSDQEILGLLGGNALRVFETCCGN